MRKIEDHLRDEYYDILPKLNLIKRNLDVNINQLMLPIINQLESYERIEIVSRVKDVGSAIEKLKSKQEGKDFKPDDPGGYTLRTLHDLVGVRVVCFPFTLMNKVINVIINEYPSWEEDNVSNFSDESDIIIYKYFGFISFSSEIKCEIQIMPMLFSRFLDVEHDIIYKPDVQYKGIKRSLEMKEQKSKVLDQFRVFESEFCKLIRDN